VTHNVLHTYTVHSTSYENHPYSNQIVTKKTVEVKEFDPFRKNILPKDLNTEHYSLNNTKLALNVVSLQDLFESCMNLEDVDGGIIAGNRLGTRVV
jgi:hypothetical protein